MKFNQILKGLILENGRYEILKSKFTEPKKKGDKEIPAAMSVEQFNKIVLGDPTTRRDGNEIKKAGTYTPWLIKQYIKLKPQAEYGTPQFKSQLKELQELFFEDLYKTTEDLQKFDRFKGQLETSQRDINTHSIDSLMRAVEDFSLEKTKATKQEKEQAATTYEHPGGEVIFRGSDWTVVKIEDQGQLGKDAACFYGGNQLKAGKGESNWCTSAPGLDYFERYIKQGPLYVVIPNKPQSFRDGGVETGEKSGLPARRYQFHFPSNQFMDPDDHRIDLVEFLNSNPELKEIFKPEFMSETKKERKISIEYPQSSSAKAILIYGFEDFFNSLPDNLEGLDFANKSRDSSMAFDIPSSIGRFKNLVSLHLENAVKKLPKEIGELSNLTFLSLPNNKELTDLPPEIGNLKELSILNIKGSPNVKLPESVQNNENLFVID